MNSLEQQFLQMADAALRKGDRLGRRFRMPRLASLQEQLAALAKVPSASAPTPAKAPAENPAPKPQPAVQPAPAPATSDPTPPRATPSSPAPAPASTDKAAAMRTFAEAVADCQKCPHLAASRRQVVFGVGNADADLMFVGEAPGADEDQQGEPFVGPAGQLLTKVIQTMGLSREEVYIANILKCRPDMPNGQAGNRPPRPEEMATCLPYLEKQVGIVQPKIIVALGGTALNGLLPGNHKIGTSRGKWLKYRDIPLRATFHPSYILRRNTIADKRLWWEDMLSVLEHLGHPISERQKQFFKSR